MIPAGQLVGRGNTALGGFEPLLPCAGLEPVGFEPTPSQTSFLHVADIGG
jgi:hypothetical protein